jgi:putative hydroxymethylpyrimidine transport system substrate-binding protein
MPLEESGIPDFYELVIIANAQAVKSNPRRAEQFIAALTRGIETTLKTPQAALEVFLKQHPDLRDELHRRSFEVTVPFFEGSPAQTLERWETLQRFMHEHGLVTRTVPTASLMWQGAP